MYVKYNIVYDSGVCELGNAWLLRAVGTYDSSHIKELATPLIPKQATKFKVYSNLVS